MITWCSGTIQGDLLVALLAILQSRKMCSAVLMPASLLVQRWCQHG